MLEALSFVSFVVAGVALVVYAVLARRRSVGSGRASAAAQPAVDEAPLPRIEESDPMMPVVPPSDPLPKIEQSDPMLPLVESSSSLPKLDYEEDAELDGTKVETRSSMLRRRTNVLTQKIVYDDDAERPAPTDDDAPPISVTAASQTDRGLRRKRNEDSVLVREDHGLFVVADGMGGYRGGEIASQLAVTTIEQAFESQTFVEASEDTDVVVPPRAAELARAIQMANEAILERARGDKRLEGMGTTICAARFSAAEQRLYIGHVGDSRVYRYRGGDLQQMTADHTMGVLGVTGEGAAHLSRVVGVWPVVPVDVVLAKPQPGDVYLVCSDGLTKMVPDAVIRRVLQETTMLDDAVHALVTSANTGGGKDNISVIVVRVEATARIGSGDGLAA